MTATYPFDGFPASTASVSQRQLDRCRRRWRIPYLRPASVSGAEVIDVQDSVR